jgi:hypothetical protein
VDQLARDKAIDPAAIEVWFADEARVGQKNKITRRWARRGSRPSAPHDQRTASTYSAVCPKGFCLTYLPHHFPLELSAFFDEMAAALQDHDAHRLEIIGGGKV